MDRATAFVCVLTVSLAAATLEAQTLGARPLADRPEVYRGYGVQLMMLEGPGPESGATVRDLQPGDPHAAWLGRGAVVQRVASGSAAARAGLEAGDIVIEVDRVSVGGAKHFARVVRHTPPGRGVPTVVVRNGLRRTLTLSL